MTEVTDDYDFGFSFTDSETVTVTSQAAAESASNNSELQALQEKITALLDSQEQIVQSALVKALDDKYKAKLKEVEGLIMPLLLNLKKNPDKAYINWPNREAVINKQIEKILAVTRGS